MSQNRPPSKAAPKPPSQQRRPKHLRPGRQSPSQLSGVQIMFAAILTIGLFLAINFSTRITSSRPLQAEYINAQKDIEQLKQEQAALLAELDYAQSDAYVQLWARQDGKMARPGEVLVIPLAIREQTDPTPVQPSLVQVETSPPKPAPWTLWWALFFDSPPPG